MHLLYLASPSTATHFFDTPGSYGSGGAQTAKPVLDGFATTAVRVYTSYASFASDVRSGAIDRRYHWVLYDLEHWWQSPLAEQQDPRTYLHRFARLAHAHGYRVIETPARDLAATLGSACPKRNAETFNEWYVRCDVAGMAAAHSDVYVLQDQANTTNLDK